ncbi:MAG: cytochrome B [SAR86 cluster bacterium]|uniref:Cytochrome B n=1 Tax=SAR86 cluster bacterium TaxID=2030880 RepID=A0A2A5C8F7_9GAMM|nr:cytochrome b [Gammaproteobacteria bacterium AH-315-E17]PCJ39758.1 MAG: cytochrome B [SAR86 cluster bacterium]
MSVKNTSKNYGTIAKWFHWGTAVLFLVSYLSIYYEIWFTPGLPPPGVPRDPAYWTSLQIHLSIGVSIAVLVILRIIWRIINRQPNEEAGSKLEHLAARAGHYALYAIMIIQPILGYIGTSVNTEYFFLFEISKFEETALFASVVSDGLGMTFQEFEVPIDFLHKEVFGRWLIWILILGHTSAAFYHHFVKRDRTIYKMTNNKKHSE